MQYYILDVYVNKWNPSTCLFFHVYFVFKTYLFLLVSHLIELVSRIAVNISFDDGQIKDSPDVPQRMMY